MANYEYNGCVTGFSEGGEAILIAPIHVPMLIEREATEYSERLVAVSLLSSNSDDAIYDCTASTFAFSDSTWDAGQFVEGIAEPWNNTGVSGYVVTARVITKDGTQDLHMSTTSHGTMEGWSPQVSMLIGDYLFRSLASKRIYKSEYYYGADDNTQYIAGVSPKNLISIKYKFNEDLITTMLRLNDGISEVLDMEKEIVSAITITKGVGLMYDPTVVTITKTPESDIQAIHDAEVSSRENYADLQFVDIYNQGDDIVINSCGYLVTYNLDNPIVVTSDNNLDADATAVIQQMINDIQYSSG